MECARYAFKLLILVHRIDTFLPSGRICRSSEGRVIYGEEKERKALALNIVVFGVGLEGYHQPGTEYFEQSKHPARSNRNRPVDKANTQEELRASKSEQYLMEIEKSTWTCQVMGDARAA